MTPMRSRTVDSARSISFVISLYVILPSFVNGSNKYHKYKKFSRMEEGFSYRSDTNGQWLSVEDIRRMAQEMEA